MLSVEEFLDIKNHGHLRVAVISPINHPQQPIKNALEFNKLAKKAYEKGAQFISGTEAGLSDYSSLDLHRQEIQRTETLEALQLVLDENASIDVVIVVGAILNFGIARYNCAVVIHKGQILGVVPKSYLPDYDEFEDSRQVVPGDMAEFDTVTILGQTVPFGTNILFYSSVIEGFVFAIEICEDSWVIKPPSIDAIANGALVIANLSASPQMVIKGDYVESMFTQLSASGNAAYLYASAGRGMDSTDLTYSGQLIVAVRGVLQVSEDRHTCPQGLVVTDIDLFELMQDRRKMSSWVHNAKDIRKRLEKPYRRIKFDGGLGNTDRRVYFQLYRSINPHPFVPANQDRVFSNLFEIMSDGLAERLSKLPPQLQKVFIGVSGGLDSTISLLVCRRAFDKLGLDPKNIFALTMPAKASSKKTKTSAHQLMRLLGCTYDERVISKLALELLSLAGHDGITENLAFENAHALVRADILRILSAMFGGIVINTSDLTEGVLGWCTKYADHAGDFAVNLVPKTIVQFIVMWIADTCHKLFPEVDSRKLAKVLQTVVETEISPELTGNGEDGISQRTEDILGPFELHDFFLYHFLRFGRNPRSIARLALSAFGEKYEILRICEVLKIFYTRFFMSPHKRQGLPDGTKVGIGISPRRPLRVPSDASVAAWLRDLETVPKSL